MIKFKSFEAAEIGRFLIRFACRRKPCDLRTAEGASIAVMTPVKIQDEAQNLSGVKMLCFVSFHSLNSTVYEKQPIWLTLRNMRQIIKFHPPTRGTDMTQHCASHRIEKSIYIYHNFCCSVSLHEGKVSKSFAFLQNFVSAGKKMGNTLLYIIILSISMYFVSLVRPQLPWPSRMLCCGVVADVSPTSD